MAEKRRPLPWRKVDKKYRFDAEGGTVTLAQAFGDCSQLLAYHFMFHPDWDAGCKSCSFRADGYNGVVEHLRSRDVRLVATFRGPLSKLLDYRDRMGWCFPWLSSPGNSFNYDSHVSFDPEQAGGARYNYRRLEDAAEELPGLSAFKKGDNGAVYHSYSTKARGLDPNNTAYQLPDLAPDGRNESGLPYPMDRVRRREDNQDSARRQTIVLAGHGRFCRASPAPG